MDTEKLRELEQEMRDTARNPFANTIVLTTFIRDWSDKLRDIIAAQPPKAELGQEVGAVYAHPVELEAARRNYARGLADGLLTVSVQPIPGFVPLYNSSATPTAAADELAALLTTRQEVAPVALGEVVEGEAAGRAISFPNGYSVTLDALAIGTKIYAGSQPSGGEHMAMHWIDRYAAGIDDEPQIDLIRDALTSPAHTSEARDACKAKYLPAGSMILGDQDYETTKPCFEVVHRGFRYYMSPTSKQSIARLNEQDAAMRQEGGNG